MGNALEGEAADNVPSVAEDAVVAVDAEQEGPPGIIEGSDDEGGEDGGGEEQAVEVPRRRPGRPRIPRRTVRQRVKQALKKAVDKVVEDTLNASKVLVPDSWPSGAMACHMAFRSDGSLWLAQSSWPAGAYGATACLGWPAGAHVHAHNVHVHVCVRMYNVHVHVYMDI